MSALSLFTVNMYLLPDLVYLHTCCKTSCNFLFQIVWGMAIGCNQEPFADVSIQVAEETAYEVNFGGFAGIATWSVNRDTNHR